MNNKNFDVQFDLGSSKIRAAAINKNDKINNFYYESDYFIDEVDSNNEIKKIISNIEKNTNEYLDSINLKIDSPKLQSISLSIFKNFDGSKLNKEDVQFLIQDAKQQILKNYLNQNIIHIIIKKYKVNSIDYTFMPSDIICNSLSIDIIFICLPKMIIEKLKKKFSAFDISIDQILCSSYSKSINYKDNYQSIKNICFIDMGFNKTSITCYENNKISSFQIIPIGGNHITKDISKVLNIDLLTAEKVKLFFDKSNNVFNIKEFSLETIQKIIFARV